MTIEEAIRYFEREVKDLKEGEAWAAADPVHEDLLATCCYEREACELALASLREKQERDG